MSEEKRVSGLIAHSKESNQLVKQCLKQAMIQLSKEMDYHQITVTKLCQRAGVSRMAFYRNYQVTNDVIYQIANDLNNEVITSVGSPFRETTTELWYQKAFEKIEEHKEEMALMFTESFQQQWMKIVNGYAVHDQRFAPEKKYQTIMWSGGFENVVFYWLNNGMKETPKQMAKYCLQYLPHMLNNLAEGD